MAFSLLIIFLGLCLLTFIAIGLVFYLGMVANRKDSITSPRQLTTFERPQASRPAPRIEQKSAIAAGLFHVLPVQNEGTTYTVMTEKTRNPEKEVQFAIALDASGVELWKTPFYSREYVPHLESDVQSVYVVDLYINNDHLCIKLENGAISKINKRNGELLTPL
jgi:hypothetical protein